MDGMPSKPILTAPDRLALHLSERGRIPLDAQSSPEVRKALADGVGGWLRMIEELGASLSDDVKPETRLKALTYLVDRYLGKSPTAGEGRAPAELPDAEAASSGADAVARSLIASLPPEHARRAIQAIEAGLKSTGKLPAGAKVTMPPKPEPTPSQLEQAREAAEYIRQQNARWEDGDG